LLPSSSILHCQDWYIEKRYESDPATGRDNLLDQASERFFQGRRYQENRSYLFLTQKPVNRQPPSSAMSSLLQSTLVPEELLDKSAMANFLGSVGRFERVLNDSGLVGLRRMKDAELAGGPGQAGIIEQYCQLTEKGQPPILRDIAFDPGSIRIGSYETAIYTLADPEHWPSLCGCQVEYGPYSTERTSLPIGFATALGPLLQGNHIYNTYILVEDGPATKKKLELKRRRLHSLSAHSRENVVSRDAVDDFLNEAASGQKPLLKMHANMLAWTDDLQELASLRNRVSSAIARMGAYPHQETVGAPQIWWAGIPGNAAEIPFNETVDCFAEQAVCFLVPETHYRSSESDFFFRMGDRISGRPLNVDLSDEPMRLGQISARNKFVLGSSGSGKSFFTNHLMRSYYEQGAHIVIVDIGNSYKGLCELVEGYYFTYTEKNLPRFNPFWLVPEEVLDTEKKESIKTLLLALWKKSDEAYGRSEYVALSNALQLYYEKLKQKTIFPCFDSFYEFLLDDYTQVLATDRVKEKDFDVHNFLYVLRPFYRGGEYDYLLNATENLDLLQKRLVVFELDNIKSNEILYTVVAITIAQAFISKMRKLPGSVRRAIAQQGMSEYIQYLFKTVRKFFGEAIVVSQEVEDIVSSPIVKQAIINNADCKLLLDQSKFQNKFDKIQELLGLTEQDKALVLSLNRANESGRKYKEVFISLGTASSKVYRTEVSPEEYYTYTTEATEKERVQEYAAREGSFARGIKALVADLSGKMGVMTVCMLLGWMLLLGGCRKPPEANPKFLPGIYVSEVVNEFCHIRDTLIIRRTPLGSAGYHVTRGCCFQRVKEGRELPGEYQSDEWQAGYNPPDSLLISVSKADKIRYDPAANKVFKQGWEYEKIE